MEISGTILKDLSYLISNANCTPTIARFFHEVMTGEEAKLTEATE